MGGGEYEDLLWTDFSLARNCLTARTIRRARPASCCLHTTAIMMIINLSLRYMRQLLFTVQCTVCTQ